MNTWSLLVAFGAGLLTQACQQSPPPVFEAPLVGAVEQGDPGPAPVDVAVLWPSVLPASEAIWSKGAGWYSASLMREGHSVLVFGTRIRFGTASKEPDRAPAVTRMDGIVEADLVRAGVAYTVAVECERPTEDERCTADDYVMGLVAQLAGGKP